MPALIVVLFAVAPTRVDAAGEKPTLLGFSSADFRADVPAFTSEAGRSPAIYQLFWGLEIGWAGADNAWAEGMLSELQSLGMTAYIEITTENLAALNAGQQNADLNALARTVGDWLKADTNRHVLIAPLPEMNLEGHAWSGSPSQFKAGYQRIRQAFLDQGLGDSQVRFVFAPNGLGDIGEYDDFYPGDTTVDLIGFAKINRGAPWRDYNVTFQAHIDEMRAKVSLTKPILITQTGSVDVNGDRDAWLNDMFTKLKAHDQVIGAIYFNRNKDGYDFRVVINGNLDPAFDSGYQQWSKPSEVSWIFDGRMDAWVDDRKATFASGFIDVRGHTFEKSITWLAGEGITLGCNPPLNTRYCPNDGVTRGEMAVFITRALHLPVASADYFNDDKGYFYEASANRLYEAGITVGCSTNRYCGDQSITRGQMAAFLARALTLPTSSKDFFVDDKRNEFESAINKVAASGITLGCNPPSNERFCPEDPVTRGQMAAFLDRGLDN